MSINPIALFGGTFDPVHLGHLKVANYAGKKINADNVIFIPAKKSPLKPNSPNASNQHRTQMLKLALQNESFFELSDHELKKTEPSYTINTVKYFKKMYPKRIIYWLAGTDSLEELTRWYRIKELIDLCRVSVMLRPGFEQPNFKRLANQLGTERAEKLKENLIETPLIEISSTEIRRRIAKSESIEGLVPESVRQYIYTHNLYND